MMPLRSLLLVLAVALLAGCADGEANTSNPSPGALAEPPTEEGLEPNPPPHLEETRERFREAMAFAERERLAERPIGEVIVALGERYLDQPYIIGPLDGFGEERLVARLDSFDCFTYVEALLAMARGVTSGDTSFEGYLQRTEQQRYREGRMEDYCSRIHYFTEWIHVNDQRGLVNDVTDGVGGQRFPKRYTFMTSHREAYPALADDQAFQCIANVEDRLNREVELFFIPQDRIAASYDQLRAGDILATATDIEGLDVTHTGIAYPNGDGTMGMMHASTSGNVVISPDLESYVQGISRQIGIIVARPVQP